MTFVSRHKVILIAATVIVLGAAAVAVAVGGGGQTRAGAEVVKPLPQQFGVFGEHPVASSASLSQKAQRWLAAVRSPQSSNLAAEAAGTSTGSGAQPATVEALASAKAADGSTVVVAAVRNQICAFDEGSEIGSCSSEELSRAGQAFSAAPDGCGVYEVLGVMPDGVSSLAVTNADGQVERSIPVQGNVYAATLKADRTTLTSSDPALSVELPLDEYAALNPAC